MAAPKYQTVRWQGQVRVSFTKKDMPTVARKLVDFYSAKCSELGTLWTQFTVFNTPKSANHMYGRRVTKQGKVQTWRKKGVDDFRLLVKEAMGESRFNFNPTGPLAVVILLENPLWITKGHQVRQMDADNRVKVLMDAIEDATGVPDELAWQIHVFKVASKHKKTTVYLFDLGAVVEYFY